MQQAIYPLKVETICFSETSAGFHWTTLIYIPEYRIIPSLSCENLSSKQMIYMTFGDLTAQKFTKIILHILMADRLKYLLQLNNLL
jgi:hypothetical protein